MRSEKAKGEPQVLLCACILRVDPEAQTIALNINILRDKLANSKSELLRNISLNRQIKKKQKRSVITIPYNIPMISTGEQIAEYFSKRWELKQYVYIVPETAPIGGQKCYFYSTDFFDLIKVM
jgi:hypothetical protein